MDAAADARPAPLTERMAGSRDEPQRRRSPRNVAEVQARIGDRAMTRAMNSDDIASRIENRCTSSSSPHESSSATRRPLPPSLTASTRRSGRSFPCVSTDPSPPQGAPRPAARGHHAHNAPSLPAARCPLPAARCPLPAAPRAQHSSAPLSAAQRSIHRSTTPIHERMACNTRGCCPRSGRMKILQLPRSPCRWLTRAPEGTEHRPTCRVAQYDRVCARL